MAEHVGLPSQTCPGRACASARCQASITGLKTTHATSNNEQAFRNPTIATNLTALTLGMRENEGICELQVTSLESFTKQTILSRNMQPNKDNFARLSPIVGAFVPYWRLTALRIGLWET